MTTQHDYKAALEDIQEGTFSHGNLTYAACVHALRLADAVQRGPSEGMIAEGHINADVGYSPEYGASCNVEQLFLAMTTKLLEEIEG